MNLVHEFVHIAAQIGAAGFNEWIVTNGENMVRWENGLQLRKQYSGAHVAGVAGKRVLVRVEPIGMP